MVRSGVLMRQSSANHIGKRGCHLQLETLQDCPAESVGMSMIGFGMKWMPREYGAGNLEVIGMHGCSSGGNRFFYRIQSFSPSRVALYRRDERVEQKRVFVPSASENH